MTEFTLQRIAVDTNVSALLNFLYLTESYCGQRELKKIDQNNNLKEKDGHERER